VHWSRWRWVRVGAVVVAGTVGYALTFSFHRIDERRMHQLILPATGLADFPARQSSAAPATISPGGSQVIVDDARRDPAHTGAYSVTWKNPTNGDSVGIEVWLLPSVAHATRAAHDIGQEYSQLSQVSQGNLLPNGTFPAPGLAEATTLIYAMAPANQRGPGTAYLLTWRQGRAAVLELAQTASAAFTQADVVKVAHAEDALLRRRLPGFSLTVLSVPVVGTLLWWPGVAVAALGVAVVPEWVAGVARRRRERRREAAQRRAASHYRVRGAAAVRRQRPAPWVVQGSGARRRR